MDDDVVPTLKQVAVMCCMATRMPEDVGRDKLSLGLVSLKNHNCAIALLRSE